MSDPASQANQGHPATPYLPPLKPKTYGGGEKCGMCGGAKFQPYKGMAICPRCDRQKCGACNEPEKSGLAQTCPSCGQDMRLTKGLG